MKKQLNYNLANFNKKIIGINSYGPSLLKNLKNFSGLFSKLEGYCNLRFEAYYKIMDQEDLMFALENIRLLPQNLNFIKVKCETLTKFYKKHINYFYSSVEYFIETNLNSTKLDLAIFYIYSHFVDGIFSLKQTKSKREINNIFLNRSLFDLDKLEASNIYYNSITLNIFNVNLELLFGSGIQNLPYRLYFIINYYKILLNSNVNYHNRDEILTNTYSIFFERNLCAKSDSKRNFKNLCPKGLIIFN